LATLVYTDGKKAEQHGRALAAAQRGRGKM